MNYFYFVILARASKRASALNTVLSTALDSCSISGIYIAPLQDSYSETLSVLFG